HPQRRRLRREEERPMSRPERLEAPSVRPAELMDLDFHLFNEGTHTRIYEKLGAHLTTRGGARGTQFAVWAPNARYVSVIGDFNGWNDGATPLERQSASGIWSGFVPGVDQGSIYKYRVVAPDHQRFDKADPYAFASELAPRTGSVVWGLDYEWHDADWMRERAKHNALEAPISIYELHLGSWRRVPEEGMRSLSYREMAPRL